MKSRQPKLPDSIRAGVDALLAPYGLSLQELLRVKAADAMSSQAPRWLSRQQAAALARVSCDTLDDWRRSGKICSAKLNSARCGRVLIDQDSLVLFITKNYRNQSDEK